MRSIAYLLEVVRDNLDNISDMFIFIGGDGYTICGTLDYLQEKGY